MNHRVSSKNGGASLIEFKARDSLASQALGYGKTLMFFHMLRQRLGDSNFLQALRTLYDTYRFQRVKRGKLRKRRSLIELISEANTTTAE